MYLVYHLKVEGAKNLNLKKPILKSPSAACSWQGVRLALRVLFLDRVGPQIGYLGLQIGLLWFETNSDWFWGALVPPRTNLNWLRTKKTKLNP